MPRPSQPAASRAELGREADKAFPAPSPTVASQKGGGRRAGGRGGEEEREEGGAAGGTGQDRGEEGRQGGGAGRPRRTGRRAGFLKPKINKLFLFTCRAGEVERVGSERSGLASSPPPSRLFVTERPAQARDGTALPPAADDSRPRTPDHGRARLSTAHREGRPRRALRRRSWCGVPGKRAKALGAPRFPPPADPAQTRRTDSGGGWGEGAADTFPKLPAPPPHPERKVEEPERGDKRKDSTLRVTGWELPLPLREVKPLAAQPTSNPPTQPFKPVSALCYHPLLRPD